MPHLHYVDGRYRGYYILDLTRERLQADYFAMKTVLDRTVEERFVKGFTRPPAADHLIEAGVARTRRVGARPRAVGDSLRSPDSGLRPLSDSALRASWEGGCKADFAADLGADVGRTFRSAAKKGETERRAGPVAPDWLRAGHAIAAELKFCPTLCLRLSVRAAVFPRSAVSPRSPDLIV